MLIHLTSSKPDVIYLYTSVGQLLQALSKGVCYFKMDQTDISRRAHDGTASTKVPWID